MKKLKYAFWLILMAFFGVVILQNMEYFTAIQDNLSLNLGFYNEPIPPLTNGAIIAICVGVSVLIMLMFYFSSRFDSYRSKKTIKSLRNGMEQGQKSISELQQEVSMLKGESSAPLTPEQEQDNGQGPKDETSQTAKG